MATYRAEKWTDVYVGGEHRELWAVLNWSGEPVATGGQAFAQQTATDYNIRFAALCDKCQRQRRTLTAYHGASMCGTCISRIERRINTQEMHGRGRRGY